MTIETLAAGAVLPEHRVSATMPAEVTENKIHEDGLARDLGFRGGLVPGVTVYAWMTHPVVAALGHAWIEHGTFRARFASPVYFDEPVRIEASVVLRTADAVTIDTRVAVTSTRPSPTARNRSWPSLVTMISPGSICVISRTCCG